MIDDINFLIETMEYDIKLNRVAYIEIIKEIIGLVRESSIDLEIQLNLLIELYKYEKLGMTNISIDPRGDSGLKHAVLYNIKEELKDDKLSQDKIDSLRHLNEQCLDFLLNPFKLKRISDEFYREHPGAKF